MLYRWCGNWEETQPRRQRIICEASSDYKYLLVLVSTHYSSSEWFFPPRKSPPYRTRIGQKRSDSEDAGCRTRPRWREVHALPSSLIRARGYISGSILIAQSYPHKPDALVFCDGSLVEAFAETLPVAEARDLRSKEMDRASGCRSFSRGCDGHDMAWSSLRNMLSLLCQLFFVFLPLSSFILSALLT